MRRVFLNFQMTLKPNQIENLLQELIAIKEKLEDSKAILNNFKIRSEKLTQLKKAKKELGEQIDEEKDRIENEYYADKDYETSKNDTLTYRNQIREKNAEIRKALAEVNVDQQLSTYEYNIKGAPLKMQVERVVKVYINGKEEK